MHFGWQLISRVSKVLLRNVQLTSLFPHWKKTFLLIQDTQFVSVGTPTPNLPSNGTVILHLLLPFLNVMLVVFFTLIKQSNSLFAHYVATFVILCHNILKYQFLAIFLKKKKTSNFIPLIAYPEAADYMMRHRKWLLPNPHCVLIKE